MSTDSIIELAPVPVLYVRVKRGNLFLSKRPQRSIASKPNCRRSKGDVFTALLLTGSIAPVWHRSPGTRGLRLPVGHYRAENIAASVSQTGKRIVIGSARR